MRIENPRVGGSIPPLGTIILLSERAVSFRDKNLAWVAQLVEQRIENPRVGGSIPPLGTIYIKASKDFSSEAFFVLRAYDGQN